MKNRTIDMPDKEIDLLIIYPGTGAGDRPYYLLTEAGEVVASHWCSNSSFAEGDLHDNKPERKEEFKERFGDYEVKFIDQQEEITADELYALNQQRKPKEEVNE